MIAACSCSLRSDDPRTDIFCVITRCAKTTPFHTTHLIIPHHSPHKNSEMTPYHVKEIPSPSHSPLISFHTTHLVIHHHSPHKKIKDPLFC